MTCWWESCASGGWGQKPWKRERLLVHCSIVSFPAQVEKKNPCSQWKSWLPFVLLAKTKGRGARRETNSQQCRCASATHRSLAGADSAKKIRFESRGRHVHGRRRLVFLHWNGSRSSLRWDSAREPAAILVIWGSTSHPSEDERQGLQLTRQKQEIGIKSRHKPRRNILTSTDIDVTFVLLVKWIDWCFASLFNAFFLLLIISIYRPGGAVVSAAAWQHKGWRF